MGVAQDVVARVNEGVRGLKISGALRISTEFEIVMSHNMYADIWVDPDVKPPNPKVPIHYRDGTMYIMDVPVKPSVEVNPGDIFIRSEFKI